MKRHILCYDIADDRRRRRIARILDGDRVQESVFEADLNPKFLDKVKTKVVETLDTDEDLLSVYPLCADCARGRNNWGRPSKAPPLLGEEVVIVI